MCVCPNSDRRDAFSLPSDKGEIKKTTGRTRCSFWRLPEQKAAKRGRAGGRGDGWSGSHHAHHVPNVDQEGGAYQKVKQTSPAGLIGAISMISLKRAEKRVTGSDKE